MSPLPSSKLIAFAFLAIVVCTTGAAGAKECRWFGTAPLCDGECPAGWKLENLSGSGCVGTWGVSGTKAYCCKVEAACGPGKYGTTSTLPQKPVKKLGKQFGVAKANDDVDIYMGPGGQFGAYQCGQLNCFMSKDETGKVLDFQDDWYKVQTSKVPNGSGWVAADHLTVTR